MGTKISALTTITGANTAAGDLLVITDVSDTTQGAGGTTKSITRDSLLNSGAIPGSFSTLTSTGNAALGDAEATDTHAIKGATTLLVNSASAALTVTQTGAGNAFVVEDSASPDSTPFAIDASGNTISGDTATFTGLYGGTNQLYVTGFAGQSISYFANNATGVRLDILKSRNATIGSHTVLQSGDDFGGIFWGGSDGSAFKPAASVAAFVDGTPGTNDMPGRLVFSTTADGESTPTERARINSTGLAVTGAVSATAGMSCTTLAASGRLTASQNGGDSVVIGSTASDTGSRIAILGSSTSNNWAIFNNYFVAGRLDFVPSTAGGGTTFTTPVFSLLPTGLAVTGAVSATTTGKVGTTLGVGNATPSASGAGITFPATQSASSDPNTLDDYEEGTWTPVIQGSGTAGTYELGTQVSTYVKVGGKVTLNAYIPFAAAITAGGTGYLQITGAPFIKAAGQAASGSVYTGGVTFTGKYLSLAFLSVGSTGTIMSIKEVFDNAAVGDLPIAAVAANDYLVLSITYFV